MLYALLAKSEKLERMRRYRTEQFGPLEDRVLKILGIAHVDVLNLSATLADKVVMMRASEFVVGVRMLKIDPADNSGLRKRFKGPIDRSGVEFLAAKFPQDFRDTQRLFP